MGSTVVIKVRHGDVLRRFIAHAFLGEFDFDMVGLREKVISLFNLPPHADFKLSYIDGDSDVVALVDDEDLRDVIRQSLNPLRITVELNDESDGKHYGRSSGRSIPMGSPRVQNPLQNLNTCVSEILKSVPEPLREMLTKLSLDMLSKVKSSAPAIDELVDHLSEMGLSFMSSFSEAQAATESSGQNGASGKTKSAAVAGDAHGSTADGATASASENVKGTATSKGKEVFPTSEADNVVKPGTKTKDEEALVTKSTDIPFLDCDHLNDALLFNNLLSAGVSMDSAYTIFHDAFQKRKKKKALQASSGSQIRKKLNHKKSIECCSIVKSSDDAFEITKPVATSVPVPDNTHKIIGTSAPSCSLDSLKHCTSDSGKFQVCDDAQHSSWSTLGFVNECPFSGNPLANDDSAVPAAPYVSGKRIFYHNDGTGNIFHRGVRCDGCGVLPITGPRFRSKVKENYNLCSICFTEMGNRSDYVRIDRPLTYGHPSAFKGYDHRSRMHFPPPPKFFKGREIHPKLDSCFIRDVNVLDGTVMAPSTPFTKIWRMKNTGTVAWPRGTQLRWIGGPNLSESTSVELIAADGLPVNEELDIVVDFTTPRNPGSYISYWRMSSPAGQKFGQHIWVHVEVDSSPAKKTLNGFNLNLPPISVGTSSSAISGPGALNSNSMPVSNTETETLDVASKNEEHDLNFPINDSLLVGGSTPHLPVSSSAVDLSQHLPTPTPTPTPPVPTAAPSDDPTSKYEVEKALLNELEEMGFKEVDVNKEILRVNKYNLEKAVDDLFVVEGWDPILDELEEMGFHNKEMNKELLKKNNGSIKRVVMELVAGEMAQV